MRTILLFACLGTILGDAARAVDPFSNFDRADQLRAGYLLNFAKFVEWPNGSSDHWTLCFVGGEGIRAAIDATQQHGQPGTRGFLVRVLEKGDALTGCQVLYIDAESYTGDRVFSVAGQAVLTVSDARDFAHHGGVVELFSEGNRLRFNINLDNARRAGLRISSSLLQLASHVEETGR